MSTVITWSFIPRQYEYKRADYIWEMPSTIVKTEPTSTPFVNEWSPSLETVTAPLNEWSMPPAVSDNPITPSIEPMQLDTPIDVWSLPSVPTPTEYIQNQVHVAMSKAFENIGQYIGDAIVQLGKDFGMWLLSVAPDTFMMIGMILCLGAIMSIPRTGKWAVIAVSLSITFEMLRRLTV